MHTVSVPLTQPLIDLLLDALKVHQHQMDNILSDSTGLDEEEAEDQEDDRREMLAEHEVARRVLTSHLAKFAPAGA